MKEAKGTKATTRAPKADPAADDSLRRRASSTAARGVRSHGAVSSSPVSAGSVLDEPLLPPVQEGTPIEIPRIVPSRFEEDEDEGYVAGRGGSTDHTNGHTTVAPPFPDLTEYTSDLPRPPVFTDADGTDGLPSMFRPERPERTLRPVTVPRARRPRVRRVTRVVRTVDTWSVFKVALCFSLFLYAVCLTAGVLLWQVAQNTGTVDNVERFFESFGWDTFELKGGMLYHNAWVGGLFLVVGLTGLCVLAATMFNLIADLVGGIRVTVLEEEVVAREERGHGWRWAPWRSHPAPPDDDPTGF